MPLGSPKTLPCRWGFGASPTFWFLTSEVIAGAVATLIIDAKEYWPERVSVSEKSVNIRDITT